MNQSTDPSLPRQRLIPYPNQIRDPYHILIRTLYRRTSRMANPGHQPSRAYLENRHQNYLRSECDAVCDDIINFVNAWVPLTPARSLIVMGAEALMELSERFMGARMHEAGLEIRERVQDMLFGWGLLWEWREDGSGTGRVRPL